MGSTGKSTGVHLDLAVYPGDRATNKSVSPLPITEQTRILFGGWATQWDTQWFNMNKEWLYKDYLSSYNLPSDSKLKAMKLTPDQFMAEANNYRASQWWKFETKEQQEEITKAVYNIWKHSQHHKQKSNQRHHLLQPHKHHLLNMIDYNEMLNKRHWGFYNRDAKLYKWFADYQDESQRRLQEIASNVKNFYTTNPEVFSNYDTFKKFL